MILVTGCAGFIGFHLALRLLKSGETVLGIDNLSPYYDVKLKRSRLDQLLSYPTFNFVQVDIADDSSVRRVFDDNKPEYVAHFAAQAGVRYSLVNPRAYVDSNVTGFLHILEGCRRTEVKHLVYASSSSVYGLNASLPFSVHQSVDHPVSLYAATKKANELMAHTYSHLFQLPSTGLRFFTVYGPWGRPDMALTLFAKAILEGTPIDVFNEGHMQRDFTYIDDAIEGVIRVLKRPAAPNPHWNSNSPDTGSSCAPYRIYNIGNRSSVELLRIVEILEVCLEKKAKKNFLPLQPGDVPITCADMSDISKDTGFIAATSIELGVRNFVDWYRTYYLR